MKRELDLRNAFAPQPESCRNALLSAARSVKEDETMKRIPYRALLIAALCLLLTTAAAFAAHTAGLFDWFEHNYGAKLPPAAQEALSSTQPQTLQAGPVTFTLTETLADGQIAYMTATARVTDGSKAVIYSGAGDPCERVGAVLAVQLAHPEITADTSLAEAADLAKAPLYCATAWFEPSAAVTAGEEMMDGTFLEDASLLLVDMLYTDPQKVTDPLEGTWRVMVQQLDTETLEPNNTWKAEAPLSIAVGGVTAEKTYLPAGTDKLLGCLTLTHVTAKQTCAGVYLTLYAQADEGTVFEQILQAGELEALDENGERFPTGMSLTSEFLQGDGTRFPDGDPATIPVKDFAYKMMVTLDALPETLTVTDGSVTVAVR